MSVARHHDPLRIDDISEKRVVDGAETVSQPRICGRYVLWGTIGSGGCATVHLGRLMSEAGFSRTVAVKRLHSEYSADPEFVAMFLDEARLAARIHHPNVVQSLDVFWSSAPYGGRELFMIMDYVEGETLARLVAKCTSRADRPPVPVVLAIASGVLRGLHAAHEARSASGVLLELVHRDVSPQNVVVGVDGVARLLDFGIAKAVGRVHTTRQGDFKGKAAYMAPEQILGTATKLSDVYAASVVFWEALTARRLFKGENQAAVLHDVVASEVPYPSTIAPDVPLAIEEIVMRGLARTASARFPTALAMAEAIEDVGMLASSSEVGAWVRRVAHDELTLRAEKVALIEGAAPAELLARAKEGAAYAAGETFVEPVTRIERAGNAPSAPPVYPARRRFTVGAAILIVLALAVPVALFLGRRAMNEQQAHRTREEVPLVPPEVRPLEAPRVSDSAQGTVGVDLPHQDPAPSAAPSAHLAPPRARGPVPSFGVRHPTAPIGSTCSPPFLIDSAGRMHFKTECL